MSDWKISTFMTKNPLSLHPDLSLHLALDNMRKGKFRHIPVLEAGKVYGVLSLTDAELLISLQSKRSDILLVKDACTVHPYTVQSNASVREVCAVMAEKKYGSAIVTESDKLVGIFTWIDMFQFTNVLFKQLDSYKQKEKS